MQDYDTHMGYVDMRGCMTKLLNCRQTWKWAKKKFFFTICNLNTEKFYSLHILQIIIITLQFVTSLGGQVPNTREGIGCLDNL